MTGPITLATISGLGCGLGLLAVIAALTGRVPQRLRPRRGVRPRFPRDQRIRLATTAAVATVIWAVTGWPVGALFAAVAAWWLPRLLGPDRAHEQALARVEAIAGWAEMLRDTLAAAAGLEHTITTTAPLAPKAIRAEVTALARRIADGQRLAPALRQLADDLNDPIADLIVTSLVLASEHQARKLAPLLAELATTAREQASMRMRIATARARLRTSIRVIVGTTLAMAGGLIAFNRGYLAPYDTATGQLVLAGIGALFAASFTWLSRMAAGHTPARILTTGAAS